jgi:hypothetical protein
MNNVAGVWADSVATTAMGMTARRYRISISLY